MKDSLTTTSSNDVQMPVNLRRTSSSLDSDCWSLTIVDLGRRLIGIGLRRGLIDVVHRRRLIRIGLRSRLIVHLGRLRHNALSRNIARVGNWRSGHVNVRQL